jgi:hypothetical protein
MSWSFHWALSKEQIAEIAAINTLSPQWKQSSPTWIRKSGRFSQRHSLGFLNARLKQLQNPEKPLTARPSAATFAGSAYLRGFSFTNFRRRTPGPPPFCR